MSIEKSLERIADALELFVSGIPTATMTVQDCSVTTGSVMDEVAVDAPPPAKKKAAKKKAAKKDLPPATEDELRLCFQEYVGKKGNEEGTAQLKELIAEYGAANIGAIKPENYAEIIAKVKSWK
jgi:hypothetical protein